MAQASQIPGGSFEVAEMTTTEMSAVEVSIRSVPENAFITFVPLNGNGQPNVEQAIIAGTDRGTKMLIPGDYMVVAVLPDGRFHEVQRHVPWPREKPRLFDHHGWKLDGEKVQLPPVTIVHADTSNMILVDDVWVDIAEADVLSTPGPLFQKAQSESPENSVARLSFDEALADLEKKGKRLPFLSELQAALEQDGIVDSDERSEWTLNIRQMGFHESGIQTGFAISTVTRVGFPDSPNFEPLRPFRGVRRMSPLLVQFEALKNEQVSAVH
jgi:hypothetical protein